MNKEQVDKIIAKVQKLLALATSCNENEAKSAARMAQELMLKYNLEAQQLNVDFDYGKEELFRAKENKTEMKFICPLLDEYFFVRVITIRNKKEKMTRIEMVGDRANTAVARYVFEFLSRKFPELWEQYKKETGASQKAKQPFYLGLYKGLKDQFVEQRHKTCTERGMVLVADPKLDEKTRELIGDFGLSKSTVPRRDAEAEAHGHAQGKKLQINKGVESKGTGTVGLIG